MENMPLNEMPAADVEVSAQTEATVPETKNAATRFRSRLLNNKQGFFATYGYLSLAAIIPAILMFLIYLVRGLYPFGDGSVLVLDLNGQYVYFYEALRDYIYGDGSLLYSFSRALGGEFLGIYDYYIASPFSWLVALFPKDRMLEALLFIFIVKSAISGFTMGFYLHHHSERKQNKMLIITFAVMYAMSSYAVIQQHNSMWIDALMWLPLLTYGIEELIKKGHFRLFTIILAVTILSNFYIGYMVCIYTVVYCFYYYFAHNANNENNPLGEKNHFVRSVIRVGGWALLAIGISAIAILSARYALSFGKDDFSNPNWEITQKFNLFLLPYKLLPSSYDTVRPEGLPFIYCGVLTIIAAPAYFLSKKISDRKKVAAAILIAFFVASFTISSLDLIWHGFQKPNWLNYRYSFMLCFILIALAHKGFEQIEFLSRKALFGVVAGISLYVILLQQMGDYITEQNEKMTIAPWATVALTLGCLLAYFIIICLIGRSKKRNKELLCTILAFIVCAEVFTSALCDVNDFDDDVTYSSYSKYNNFLDTFRPIVDTIKDNDTSFYRMEKTYHKKTNDPMALGMNGLSLSTSTLNKDTINYLKYMGYASKSHWSKYWGGNPANDSLLGVKYIISDYDMSEYYGTPLYTRDDYNYPEDVTLVNDKQYNVYLNPYALSLVYGVDKDYADFDMLAYDTPFERINAMVASMLGEDEPVPIFVPTIMSEDIKTTNLEYEHISASRTADKIEEDKYEAVDKSKAAYLEYSFTVPTGTDLYYFNPTGYTRQVKLAVNGKTKEPITDLTLAFAGNETTRSIYLGKSETEALTLKITMDSDSKNFYTRKQESYIYYIDMAVLDDAMNRLAKTQVTINEDYEDDNLTGTVKTNMDNQLMFTSIPYDEGWNVYVDGKKVDIIETSDALLSFTIKDSGDHEIQLQYMPASIMLGIVVSIASTIVLVAILAAYPFLKKSRLFRKTVLVGGEELPKSLTDEDKVEMCHGDIGYLEDDELGAESVIHKEKAEKASDEKSKSKTNTPKGKSRKK